ncbi:major histocompatibility complex class I-related gene protein isoform 3 precursor, partial [Camelus ferus]
MVLLLPLIVVLTAKHSDARSHSLRYFRLGVSDPGHGIPEFISVGYVDSHPITTYDSVSRRKEPRALWVAENLAPDHWERHTQLLRGWQQTFTVELKQLRHHYNHSGDEGSRGGLLSSPAPVPVERSLGWQQMSPLPPYPCPVPVQAADLYAPLSHPECGCGVCHFLVARLGLHTYQRMMGCELLEDGSTTGFLQYAYDGQDFLIFNKDTLSWMAMDNVAHITKRAWEANRHELQYQKNWLEEECIACLKRFLEYGKDTLQRTGVPCDDENELGNAIVKFS